MRTGYVPRDVLKSTTNISSELNDSIRVFNFTCGDSDISEGTASRTNDEDTSSFTDDLSASGPLNSIPCLTIIEEYSKHNMPG